MSAPVFRSLPPDDKGYPGQTTLVLPDGRILWTASTGPDAEALLLEAAEGGRERG